MNRLDEALIGQMADDLECNFGVRDGGYRDVATDLLTGLVSQGLLQAHYVVGFDRIDADTDRYSDLATAQKIARRENEDEIWGCFVTDWHRVQEADE